MNNLKMKNKEIFRLYQGLQSAGNLKGGKFAYTRSRNMSRLQPTIAALESFLEVFNMAQQALFEKHGKLNEANQMAITSEEGVSAMNALRAEHKPTFDEYEKLLEEEVDVNVDTLPFESVPDEITGDQLHNIREMVED